MSRPAGGEGEYVVMGGLGFSQREHQCKGPAVGMCPRFCGGTYVIERVVGEGGGMGAGQADQLGLRLWLREMRTFRMALGREAACPSSRSPSSDLRSTVPGSLFQHLPLTTCELFMLV